MVIKSLSRRAGAAAIALLCLSFLSTCDFLTSDIFPSWLSYVDASVDLRSILKAQGLGDLAVPDTAEYAAWVFGGTDYSKVLVFGAGNGTNRLIILDAATLAFKKSLSDTGFSRSLAPNANGFLCGSVSVSALDLTTITSAHVWSNAYSVRVFHVGIGAVGLNYAVDPNSNQQALFQEYSHDWTTQNHSVTRNFDSLADTYEFLDADYVNGYSVLGRRQNDPYLGFVTSFSLSSDIWPGGTVFDIVGPVQTGPFPVSESWAWLTEGGPVAFVRGNNGSDRLVRYRYGTGEFSSGTFGDFAGGYTTSEVIDSVSIGDDDEISVLSFDPSGTWWFLYNRRTGILYKLRTWWK